MNNNFYLALAFILILPLIPAFILYKYLPDKNGNTDEVGGETGSLGPLKSLSWKFKGAFAGYFGLVMVGSVLQYFQANNEMQKQIDGLNQKLTFASDTINALKSDLLSSANPVVDWHIKGIVKPGEKEGTRFFFDDGTTTKAPDGVFELIKRSLKSQGKASPPKWVCVYNPGTGFQVVSLNRELNHPDIETFNVAFDDSNHTILIRKPIDINSKTKDSTIAVANFIEANTELKTKFLETDPNIFREANILKADRRINKMKIDNFEKMKSRRVISTEKTQ
jgi:hypothetical protein